MSTLNVDALVGNTSANAITVRGEGTATTSLQQGLAKCWAQFAGSSLSGTGTTGVNDSFNLTSMTDDGTGRYTANINNDMLNDDYSANSTIGQSASSIGDYIVNIASIATGSFQTGSQTRSGNAADSALNSVLVHGDLA